jgi:serine/threonine protein kinase
VGTPLYFSPEQTSNKKIPNEMQHKIDIYSLGLILLELSVSITTTHEKLKSFYQVKEKRMVPEGSKLDSHIEAEMILELT